jgi:hypothetical protein
MMRWMMLDDAPKDAATYESCGATYRPFKLEMNPRVITRFLCRFFEIAES